MMMLVVIIIEVVTSGVGQDPHPGIWGLDPHPGCHVMGYPTLRDMGYPIHKWVHPLDGYPTTQYVLVVVLMPLVVIVLVL